MTENTRPREIMGLGKKVKDVLKGKYSIDYYQREYNWKTKQVLELIQDLAGKFLDDYQENHSRADVQYYSHYFLGSIIVSSKNGKKFIVDGQQRLTTLTLLLIFLRNRQGDREDKVNVDDLIYSSHYGTKSFNLDIEEREPAMRALFEQQDIDETDQPESVRRVMARYRDIEQFFPDEILEDALPYFLDWLLENVHLVEITAYDDNDAYTIFETMNDRGLSLSPTDMLKGYLLANIVEDTKKTQCNEFWRARIQECNEIGKEVAADSFKTWLRSQYADTIRERKRGAIPQDFDVIGTAFHRWIRDNRNNIGLDESRDFIQFIQRDFRFYSRQYLCIMDASQRLVPGLEHICYNADHGFTLQPMLLLAPLRPDDTPQELNLKLNLVARFLDILLTRRLWNFRSIAYSTMQYAMFIVTREIRRLPSDELAHKLHSRLQDETETFATNTGLYVHQQNRRYLHRILARITAYIEQESGMASHYAEYVSESGRNRYEVEHIWADMPGRHQDDFDHPNDFANYRNRIGGLVLLPKKFNSSFGSLVYAEKLPHYNGQNVLARSLHPDCYDHNPGFLTFVKRSGLPFKPYPEFRKADLDQRGELYRALAEKIWHPDILLEQLP